MNQVKNKEFAAFDIDEETRLRNEIKRYEKLLAQPLDVIAAESKDFQKTYQAYMEINAQQQLTENSYKETAMKFALLLDKTKEDVAVELEASKENLMKENSCFGNNLNQTTLDILRSKKNRK